MCVSLNRHISTITSLLCATKILFIYTEYRDAEVFVRTFNRHRCAVACWSMFGAQNMAYLLQLKLMRLMRHMHKRHGGIMAMNGKERIKNEKKKKKKNERKIS